MVVCWFGMLCFMFDGSRLFAWGLDSRFRALVVCSPSLLYLFSVFYPTGFIDQNFIFSLFSFVHCVVGSFVYFIMPSCLKPKNLLSYLSSPFSLSTVALRYYYALYFSFLKGPPSWEMMKYLACISLFLCIFVSSFDSFCTFGTFHIFAKSSFL